MKMHVSQTFYSVQGEGPRTGKLSVWLRTFGCSLRCKGFGQSDPINPSTYKDAIKVHPMSIKTLDEFPIVEVGCDTLYAIDPKFKHLKRAMDVFDIKRELETHLPDGTWRHPNSKNEIDLCITGGEPLLQQEAIAELISSFDERGPKNIQFETNMTKHISPVLEDAILKSHAEFHFNISPKLTTVTGEHYKWDSKILHGYSKWAKVALKIVINDSDIAWKELDDRISLLKTEMSLPPIYIMPVGATYDQQTDYEIINKIAKRAIDSGYHISGRLHCILFGNEIDK